MTTMLTSILIALATSFGAVCDGVHDDTPGISAALAAEAPAGVVRLPSGHCRVVGDRATYRALITDGVDIVGEGRDSTFLELAPGAPQSARVLVVTGAAVLVSDLTIDGGRGAQSEPDGQRHCAFVLAAQDPVFRRVTARNCTGDGFTLYTGTTGAFFDDAWAVGNGRDGLSIVSAVDGTTISGGRFAGNAAQQIDSEPGAGFVVSRVVVRNAVIDPAGSSADYALTISGTSVAEGRDWRVERCSIFGPVLITDVRGVVFRRNDVVATGAKAGIRVYRGSRDVRIAGNDVDAEAMGVNIEGTAGSGPADVVVVGNDVHVRSRAGYGIRVAGAVSASVTGNLIDGVGPVGVLARATVASRPFERFVATENDVRGWSLGVSFAGNGAAVLLWAEVARNAFTGVQRAVSLDDGTGALVSSSVHDNVLGPGVSP